MKKAIIILSVILVALAASTTTLAVMLATQNPADKEVVNDVVVEETKKPAQPVGSGESVTIEVGDTNSQTGTNGYISRQDALNVALQNLGVTISNVRDIEVDLEYKFGKVFYEVELESGQYEYKYHIDPTSGAVLKIFKEVVY